MKPVIELLNTSQICDKFIKLIKECDEFYMMVAWATHKCSAYRVLVENVNKIKKAVVGLDFSQTSPEFIRKFSENNAHVRFFTSENKGVYHPKLYVFKDNKNGESFIIIGSSNFTQGGFGTNYECSLFFRENASGRITKKIIKKINGMYEASRRIHPSEIEEYEKSYKKNTRKKLPNISGSSKENGFNLTWNRFKKMAEKNEEHNAEYCKKVLKKGQAFWKRGFNNLNSREKGCFVGKYKSCCENDEINWHCFGDMRRVLPTTFNRWACMSNALNKIPALNKKIQRKHYDDFLKELKKGVEIERGFSFASRLLCLKRPDYFVCITKKNKKKLEELFNLKLNSRDDYWNFIEEVHTAKWYREAPKKDKLYSYRMAILDAIAYDMA